MTKDKLLKLLAEGVIEAPGDAEPYGFTYCSYCGALLEWEGTKHKKDCLVLVAQDCIEGNLIFDMELKVEQTVSQMTKAEMIKQLGLEEVEPALPHQFLNVIEFADNTRLWYQVENFVDNVLKRPETQELKLVATHIYMDEAPVGVQDFFIDHLSLRDFEESESYKNIEYGLEALDITEHTSDNWRRDTKPILKEKDRLAVLKSLIMWGA